MSTWLERQASNHQVQLVATAILSGIAVAGIIYGSQAARRKSAIDELKASIPELSETHHAEMVCGETPPYPKTPSGMPLNVTTDRPSEAYRIWLCRSCRFNEQGR